MKDLIIYIGICAMGLIAGVVIWILQSMNRQKPTSCYGCKFYNCCGHCSKTGKKPQDPFHSCSLAEFINS